MNLGGKLGALLIRGYQHLISPWMPNCCRFYPTCSEYGRVAFIRYGFFKGMWLAALRILRCNPWHPGGWDPVPCKPGEPEDPPEVYSHPHDNRFRQRPVK